MIKKLFDARSPIWQLAFAVPVVAYLSYAADQATDPMGGFHFDNGPAQLAMFIYLTVVGICAALVVRRYNEHHHGSKRLSIWQLYPSEVQESDEMQSHASKSAARKVYMYNNAALPILVIGVLFYLQLPLAVGLLLGLYLTGYYLSYLFAMWPYLGED